MVFLSLPLFSKIEGNETYVFPPFEKSSTVLAMSGISLFLLNINVSVVRDF
jgi:hypothetical protein